MSFRLARLIAAGARHWMRGLAARWRDLPAFLILGAQKAGTTSLHDLLAQHPDIGMSVPKEVHYFDLHYGRGESWYRAAFPFARRDRVCGEASPFYLLHPHVPQRVARDLPGVKLIAMLREPASRTYSSWQHSRRKGLEPLPFAAAIEREEERTEAAWERLVRDPAADFRPLFRHAYLRRSRYAEQLERWYTRFPQEEVLILRSEDFFADPHVVAQQVTDWLGLRSWTPPVRAPKNTSEYDAIDPAMARQLRDYFAPFNQRLYELIGRDMQW